MKTKTDNDAVTVVMFAVACLVLILLYSTNTDSDGRARCANYMADARTLAESAAVLSERPTREVWRDLAPTCRALLSEAR